MIYISTDIHLKSKVKKIKKQKNITLNRNARPIHPSELHVEPTKCTVTVKIQGFIANPFVTNTKKSSQSIYFFQHGTVVSDNYF